MNDALADAFRRRFGEPVGDVRRISAHASDRLIVRLSNHARSVVGVIDPNPHEHRCFRSFTSHFGTFGLPVPEIYFADDEARLVLVEDLGDVTLLDVIQRGRREGDGEFPEDAAALLRKVLVLLPRFQVEAGARVDFSICHPRQSFDRDAMLWDMQYFVTQYVERRGLPFDRDALAADFGAFAEFLGGAAADYFMYRDLQSRNVMVKGGDVYFIDYQGGRRGPLHYDVASLLYQSRAAVPRRLRDELVAGYLDGLSSYVPVDRHAFSSHLGGFVLLRLMQVLGTYGRHGLGGGKPYFVESLPYARSVLREVLATSGLPGEMPALASVLERAAAE